MNLITRQKNVKASTQADLSSEELFNKAWQRVAKQQKKNDRLREQIKSFAEQITESVEQQEKAYITTLYQSCEHLLVFYGRKSLAAWQREVLMQWILDYVETISSNPFANNIELVSFYRTMETIMKEMHPEAFDPCQDDALHSEQNFFDEMTDGADSESMFEELFSEFEHGSDEFFRQQESFEQQRKKDQRALNKLMKSASINKLFRRVARILHPDLEQDEQARIEKNRLMSELIEARDNNDISTLFAFYAKYIGQSPLEELGSDLADATQLLNRQYAQLRSQYSDILHEDPKAGLLYQRFYKKSMKASLQEINAHLTDLEQDINNLKLFCKEVTSLNKLRPYLQMRREQINAERW